MTEIEQKKLEIGNRLFELWDMLPEPKKSYTHYYQGIEWAIENWHLVASSQATTINMPDTALDEIRLVK
ncbi:hypothetical protein KA005_15565 [bacterium]|nr:hypothetical protein [bacterium]